MCKYNIKLFDLNLKKYYVCVCICLTKLFSAKLKLKMYY